MNEIEEEEGQEEPAPLEDNREISRTVARVLKEKQAEDIQIMEVFHLLPVCDFFVIATGRNARHLTALSDHLEEQLKDHPELDLKGIEGYEEGLWVLVDYGSIIVHLFQDHVRDYYRMESLWADAPEIDWQVEDTD